MNFFTPFTNPSPEQPAEPPVEKQAGIVTPIVFLILIAVLALVPELTILLSAPVVVAGFNALFGISIATPIIQSLLRHLEATENHGDSPPLLHQPRLAQ